MAALLLLLATAAGAAPPNLVFFLTDDQDQLLGGSFPISPFNKGATPLPNVQKLMVEEGATATNFFIHTPICALPLLLRHLLRFLLLLRPSSDVRAPARLPVALGDGDGALPAQRAHAAGREAVQRELLRPR